MNGCEEHVTERDEIGEREEGDDGDEGDERNEDANNYERNGRDSAEADQGEDHRLI